MISEILKLKLAEAGRSFSEDRHDRMGFWIGLGFLNLDAADIWGRVILCCEGLPVCWAMLRATPVSTH